MAAVRNLRSITPRFWVPPIYTANFKVTVERSDATIDDITDIIEDLSIEDGVTEGIGIFSFTVPNPNETYTTAWTGMEIFRFYCDYNSGAATTLRFRGRVEKPSNQDNRLKVTGRSESLFVQDQNVFKDYAAKDAGYIIKDLFDSYGQSRYDTSGISVSTGITQTFTFSDTPFWDAIEAVCLASGYDCYVAPDLDVEFFEAGTRVNTTEGMVHDYNLIEVGDFAPDLQFVKNKIRVFGGTVDGVQVVYTANDSTSQTTHGIRRETVNDDGILTLSAAKELADYLLAERKNPPTVGELRGTLLATIQPGENIRCSSPLEGIPPTNYRVVHYKHEIGQQGLYTTITLNKEPRRLSHILKDRIQREHTTTDSGQNPSDLDFGETELFAADSGTHVNTEITGGVLKLQSTQSSGDWTSPVFNTADSNDVSNIRVTLLGDNLPGVSIQVSADNGVTYESTTRNTEHTMTVTGAKIKVKLSFTEGSTQVDSLGIQYSTS